PKAFNPCLLERKDGRIRADERIDGRGDLAAEVYLMDRGSSTGHDYTSGSSVDFGFGSSIYIGETETESRRPTPSPWTRAQFGNAGVHHARLMGRFASRVRVKQPRAR